MNYKKYFHFPFSLDPYSITKIRFKSLVLILIFMCSCTPKKQLELIDKVEVLRDKHGINHIYANNQQDLFFMQGYLAAKDRLFQFEIWRRQATGTVAEIFGESELKRDIGTRLFKFRGNIKDELNHYHEDGYEIISSYTDGINAYIEEVKNQSEKLPVEFTLLNIQPEFWTPADVISRHQGLLGNIGQELNIGRAVSRIGEEKVKELLWLHPKDPSLKLDKKIRKEDLDQDILGLYNAYRTPIKFKKEYLQEKFQKKEALAISFSDKIEDTEDEFSIGSNNWAISGNKSFNGSPILANDPHRSIVAPSLRYITHLVAPGWNVIGGGEPEIPGISIGHNGFGAWGLTVFRTDAEDLYVYEINPKNSKQYWHNGEWLDFKEIKETILVKGKENHEIVLQYSIHGPVTFVDENRNRAYGVRCGWLEIGGSPYLASLRMNQSQSWEEFREACNYSHIPGENMVWADKEGTIGWQAVGIAPIRNTHSGLVPVLGDGSYEWDGYLPITDKPHVVNPSENFFASANQNVTPAFYEHWNAIGFSWSDPYRGDRVNSVLSNASRNKFTMQDMMDLQVDYHSLPSEKLIKMIDQTSLDPAHKKYVEMLLAWNNKLTTTSVEATIYVNWERTIIREFHDKFVPKNVKGLLNIQLFKIIERINKLSTKERDEFLKNTFVTSNKELKSKFGTETSKWLYGQQEYKHIKIKHPLEHIVNDSIYKLVSFKTYPRGGNAYTPGSSGSNLRQSSGASFRVVIDTKDWDNSKATNSPGQSGDPNSIFYRNLYEDWANDSFFELHYSKQKVNANLHNKKVYYPKN
ncbi:penicillin acylase family protein [Flavobacteriaceae bacterium]|jgi:penicillin amidase|nr:penicillin acylase family protein [Flavobacteriaceae bacterium]